MKRYIKLYPCEGIDDDIINSISRNRIVNIRRSNNITSGNQLNNFIPTFPNFSYSILNQSNMASYGFSNLITIPELNDSNVPLLLKDEELEKLESVEYKDVDNCEKDKACIFTQSDFKENDMVIVLPCKHVFSDEEIKRWLSNVSYKCPTCRESVGEYYAKLN